VGAFNDHAERARLDAELHARPPVALTAPALVSHVAMLNGEGGGEADRMALVSLCRRLAVPAPTAGSSHYFVDFGAFRLKWERHTEFTSWTFFVAGGSGAPFSDTALTRVPRDWLDALPGERLNAIHVALLRGDDGSRVEQDTSRLFDADSLCGSVMAGGRAIAWTDFRVKDDGFGRRLIVDRGLTERQAGRLVQRLIEIGTYHMMALLALPVAREAAVQVSTADRSLVDITGELERLRAPGGERGLLDRLTRLAAEIERVAAHAEFRFGAARAYYALVERRIGELREQRMEGVQTVGEFMDRRLAPAMRTCEAAAMRLSTIADRLARTGALLRTRVEIALQDQNQALLASMDRRARLQLRLQQTVEGLSVAAISYYLVGLAGYGFRALGRITPSWDYEVMTGLAIVPIVACVYAAMRRIRRRLSDES
jgi:uncharacterized membrane-anchored protein